MNTTLCSAMFAVSLSISLPAWADQAPANNESSAGAGDTIGTINFRADCSESVRADVDHALGMMHHMMYAQAQAEFEAIIQEDPGCAMAHWGVATSLFQPLWGTTPSAADITRGRQAIQEARNAVGDKRERLLIDATAAFFDTETDSVQERLAGWIARAEGDSARAIELMRSAGELEATAEKHPVTPGALLPPYESLDDLLLALDRPEDALAAYENSNRTWPQRYNTLDGAARAANAAGDTESAALWARRLMEAAPGNERAFTAM